MEEKLNFDFGFDPERDANLIAKNCFSTFANDPVGLPVVSLCFLLFVVEGRSHFHWYRLLVLRESSGSVLVSLDKVQ